MGRRNRHSPFASERVRQAEWENDFAYLTYFDILKTMYMAKFDWTTSGRFSTVDTRILEELLFYYGRCTMFAEDITGGIYVLPFIGSKVEGVYAKNLPTRVQSPRFNQTVNSANSLVIYEKSSLTCGALSTQIVPPINVVGYYAQQLSNISRAMDVNLSSLRTPLIFSGDEKQKQTLANLMAQYDSNSSYIFMADRNNKAVAGGPEPVTVIQTATPFYSDKFQTLFTQKWQEAMTSIGLQNANVEKKERLLVDEINSNNTQVSAITWSQLRARQDGCDRANLLFGGDGSSISVEVSEAVIEPMSNTNAIGIGEYDQPEYNNVREDGEENG